MDRIGRYEIVGELGRGAMGVVYHARDPKIGRDVAIKTIKIADQAGPAEETALRERLFREAQSAGRLSHAGIVTIYDVDQVEDLAYIAMELVEGRTLEGDLGKGAVADLNFAGDILSQTAAALDYAHQKEIVHRDIKPSNLMLTSDGVVKVMDFGIARISSSSLTQTGAVLGTPSYMSPEQVRGEVVDGSSDQFSLGVIAYEMLTGKKPFTGENLTAVILKIVSNAPSHTAELCPWISPELDAVIIRALEKKPENRFGNCSEFAEAFCAASEGLTPVVVERPAVVTPAPPPAEDLDATVDGSPAVDDLDRTQLEPTVMAAPPPTLPPAKTPAAEEKPAVLPPIEKPPAPAPPPKAIVFTAPKEPEPSGSAKRLLFAAVIAAVILVGAVAVFNPRALTDPAGAMADLTGERPVPPQLVLEPEPLNPTPQEESVSPPVVAEEPPAPDPAAEPPVTTPEPTPTPVTAPPRAPRLAFASVDFASNQNGALVTVDANEELSCTAPCRLEEVPRGKHTARASLEGFHNLTRPFEVKDQPDVTVRFDFQDSRPTALITSQPTGADIYVNGEKQPVQTNARIRLAPGEYQIRVEKEGVGASEGTLEVIQDQTPIARFTLEASQ